MARTEYYDDPAAPEPNSLVVAASAVVCDDVGRILLQRRSDESTELRFVAPSELDSLDMHHTQRLRLTHYLEGRSAPYLG